MVKSNYLIGDAVYVEMPTFKGMARVSGVENRKDGTYYYLTSGADSSRKIIYAHQDEVHAAMPAASDLFNRPVFFFGRSGNGRN